MEASSFLAWFAPILSALVICAGQLTLNNRFKVADEKRDLARIETTEKREAEAKWRIGVDKRLDDQDEKIDIMLELQCSQTRSDILHKCHRYIDDLGSASQEEKDSLHSEHEDYKAVCKKLGIENNFIALLVDQVMRLPDRNVHTQGAPTTRGVNEHEVSAT